jgi:DUF4097 and DUF4098 domain-containing protein YvlB
LVTALAISSVGLVACDPITDKNFADTRTESAQLTELHVEGDAGGVTLVRDTSATQTTIARHFHYSGTKPALTGWDSVSDTTLTVNTSCGRKCVLDFTITVPSTVKVTGRLDSGQLDLTGIGAATLEADSGHIKVHDASGDVNAGSDSGSVTVTDVHGRLNLQTQSGSVIIDQVTGATTVSTDSGSVRATGLSGTQTSIHTESGSVSVGLATAQDLKAETDSGSLRVTVPSGSYRLTQSTDSGHVLIGVPVDNVNGQHALQLKTQSGSITVTQA